jgi:hypothetical protein
MESVFLFFLGARDQTQEEEEGGGREEGGKDRLRHCYEKAN